MVVHAGQIFGSFDINGLRVDVRGLLGLGWGRKGEVWVRFRLTDQTEARFFKGIGEGNGMGFGIGKAARRAGELITGAGGGVMVGLRLGFGGGGLALTIQLVIVLLVGSAGLCPAETMIQSSAPVIDQDRLGASAPGTFLNSQDGFIVDGPRQAEGEPIDYTSIMTSDYLSYLFAKSVSSCSEGIRYCGVTHFRLESEKVRLLVNADIKYDREISSTVEVSFDQTLGKGGFIRVDDPNTEGATLSVVVGNVSELVELLSEISDDYGVDYYGYLESVDFSEEALRNFNPCYLSTIQRRSGVSTVFVPPEFLEECLPQAFMAFAGLYETAGGFPSVTSFDGEYRIATRADLAFLYALGRDDFPEDATTRELSDYFFRISRDDPRLIHILGWD